MNPFTGGIAVITGAGSGIGAGLARHASELGMTVVLADVDGDAIGIDDALPVDHRRVPTSAECSTGCGHFCRR